MILETGFLLFRIRFHGLWRGLDPAAPVFTFQYLFLIFLEKKYILQLLRDASAMLLYKALEADTSYKTIELDPELLKLVEQGSE